MTFTKEQLIEQAKSSIERYSKAVVGFPRHLNVAMDLELTRIALASLEAESKPRQPELSHVIYHFRDWNEGFPIERFKADYVISWMLANYPPAQPAPVSVPDAMEPVLKDGEIIAYERHGERFSTVVGATWNACRAAMLQGAEPVSQPYTLPEVIDENLVEGLRLLQCMLDDYRERNYGHAHEWIRHIDRKFAEHSESHEDDAYSIFSSLLQGAAPVTTANKLREGVAAIRNSGIAIDAEKIQAERDALNSPVIPDGCCIMPKKLTAENGAKGALSGEFSETKFINCPECFGDDECETCDGSGRIEISVPVSWTTIKEIWDKGVEHFAVAPQQEAE